MHVTDDMKKIANATVSVKGEYFRDGFGQVLVKQLIYKSMDRGPTFVMEGRIVKSASKGDVDSVTKQPVVPNAPGANVSWPQVVNANKSAPANIRGFILAAANAPATTPNEVFFEAFTEAIGPSQVIRGMLLNFSSYQQQTENQKKARKGETNTYIRFSHCAEGNSPEEVAARRAELDKTDPVHE